MIGQNQPLVYANGAVVIVNQPGRQNMVNPAMQPISPSAGVPMGRGASNGPQPLRVNGYGGALGRQDRFLPVIQAQRPPYMQHPAARKGGMPYMGAYGTRQVFAPQPPPGPMRGASAPRAFPNGYGTVRGPTQANNMRRQSKEDVMTHEASRSNGYTSERQSLMDSRSGTIVVPFHGGAAGGGETTGDGEPVMLSASPLAIPSGVHESLARGPPARRSQQRLPSLSSLNNGFSTITSSTGIAGSHHAPTYDFGAGGGQSDAGDIFTPLVDDESGSSGDSHSSESVDIISTSDSSPAGQYALSPELAANLNDYEDDEVRDYIPEVYFCGTRTCSKVLGIEGRPQNNGYDDEKNHYIITIGDHISYRYEIQKELGRGTFGVVVRAYDHKDQREVAVKIIKNKPSYTKQAKEEVDVLANLQRDDPSDEKNIVRLLDTFTFRNHFIIVFELLSIDLYNMVYKNGFRAMPMEFIYDFCEQLLTALAFVRRHNIVHCDFKPENIVVCHQTSLASPGTNLKRLKLIDFGSACFENRRVHTYIQSRYYRAPEVVLGIAYTAAIDMWSLGCVVCELANGYPIFPGTSEGDLLQRMVEYLGHVPVSVQTSGKRASNFYEENGLHLKPKLSAMPSSAGVVPSKPHRFTGPNSKSLSAYLQSAQTERDDLFLDFVMGCLRYDPEARLTPTEALAHPWMEKWRRQRAARKGRGR